MSGHSKWSQIKRQKGAADARRSSLFTKLSANITSAARSGADPTMNFKLRLAIEKARQANMPNDNVDRAIQRAAGAGEAAVDEVTYELYGPGSAAVMATAITDNRNRTMNDVRTVINKAGAALAASGSVAWLFSAQGIIRVSRERLPAENEKREELTLALIDAGASDVQEETEGLTVLCPPTALEAVQQVLTKQEITPDTADVELIPSQSVTVSEKDRVSLNELIEKLEALDDVQSVVTNADAS